MSQQKPKMEISNRALEMIMRDVLEGMEEISLHLGYRADFNAEAVDPLSESPAQTDNIIYLQTPLKRIA